MSIRDLQIIFFFLFIPGKILHAQSDVLEKQIGKILKYEAPVDFNVVPGILIGVIDGDSTYQFNFGNEIEPDGIYELGSVSKPVLAWLIDKALDSLHLSVDNSVCSFLPDSLCTHSWSKISIDDLLVHQAGLMRFPPGIGELEISVQDPYRAYTMDHLAKDIKSIHPIPGMYSYSNIGYAMMYWLFEKVGGLDEFTFKRLNKPYRLDKISWIPDDRHIAPGFGMDGRPQPPWHTNALIPSIGLRSSLTDMLGVIRILFSKYDHRSDLNNTSLKKEIKELEKRKAFKLIDGWFVVTQDRTTIFYHTGRTGGHQASVAFIPHLKKGVVIFSNGALGSNDLSLLILRMLRKSHTLSRQK